MLITKLKLVNFRCFENIEFDFGQKFVFVEGSNGSGKTSILEAIHYVCYLRSFRTHKHYELSNFGKDYFFIKINFLDDSGAQNYIQVGFSQKDGKVVKVNDKQVNSYKEIISLYKVISTTEDDLQLILGSPEGRRTFLDHSLFLLNSEVIYRLKKFKQILQQRNAFLFKHSSFNNFNKNLTDELYAWTNQLWQETVFIQEKRIEFLVEIEKKVNELIFSYFDEIGSITIKLDYFPKGMKNFSKFDDFWEFFKKTLLEKELKFSRSSFGIHLDDFEVSFKEKNARIFASRGQQKLILFLLKVVQLEMLQKQGRVGCLLLDDFMTDFDEDRIFKIFSLLKNIQCQVFITSPIKSLITSKFYSGDGRMIELL